MGSAVAPLVHHLQKHLIQSGYVQADETVCQVLKTPGKSDTTQPYMWVYMTGNSQKPAVVYEYQESRKGAFAQAFLRGFQGVLQSDGYSGYNYVKEQTIPTPIVKTIKQLKMRRGIELYYPVAA